MVDPFHLIRTPDIYFGAGKISMLPRIVKQKGDTLLVLTGANSFRFNHPVTETIDLLQKEGIAIYFDQIAGEPSSADIDRIVEKYNHADIQLVASIGGGSVIDAGKAVSAMLPLEGSVSDYIEGVGKKSHPGIKKYFVAIPTTAGTGSEATANSVISEIGEKGYKRSLRHENLVPDVAIVDPQLVISCPPDITAASGMDAFTQLLESFLSEKSGTLNGMLASEGMSSISKYLYKAYTQGDDLEARTHVSYAALLSGITLANSGLGLIHGFASTIGGLMNIPHGVICGRLMGPVNRYNVQKLLQESNNKKALDKYASLGAMLSSGSVKSQVWYARYTVDYIEELTHKLSIPNLGRYGLKSADLERIAALSGHKENPVTFTRSEMVDILKECI